MNSDQNGIQRKAINTAVLFLVFNRIETTIRVFKSIQYAMPPKLYISSDGARNLQKGEEQIVNSIREYLLNNINWPCEVKTMFHSQNLGCKQSVSTAITWFFKNEKMGIILEDDCLPAQSFFWFCETLLNKYENDMRVWHISGVSTIPSGMLINHDSYYFSKYIHIWGWASWANRWEKYDLNLKNYKKFVAYNAIRTISDNKILQKRWINNFNDVLSGKIDTWDYQWYFCVWANGGNSIIPCHNLVSNIGFGKDATHTKDINNRLSNMPMYEINNAIKDPEMFCINYLYDIFNAGQLFDLSKYGYFIQALL